MDGAHAQRPVQEDPRREQERVIEPVLQIVTVQDNPILCHLLRPETVGVDRVALVRPFKKTLYLNLYYLKMLHSPFSHNLQFEVGFCIVNLLSQNTLIGALASYK